MVKEFCSVTAFLPSQSLKGLFSALFFSAVHMWKRTIFMSIQSMRVDCKEREKEFVTECLKGHMYMHTYMTGI